MDVIVKAFLEEPSEQWLDECSREQLLKIVDYYEVDVGDRRVKETIRSNLKVHLCKMKVLGTVKEAGASVCDDSVASLGVGLGLSFEQQKELLELRLKFEAEKELSLERIKQETELAKLELQRQQLQVAREDRAAAGLLPGGPSVSGGNAVRADAGNDLSDLRLVPKFNERDPETFFLMFERLGDARGWSEATRALLLQCVITGRAQEAYSSLSSSECGNYATVKSAILKAFELVPEAYRQRFRTGKRGEKSHMEFARDLSTYFDRWCVATDVESYDGLRELVILEQFKNSLSERIATYISERKVKTTAEAAALADDYVLTHGGDAPVARGGGHRDAFSGGSAGSGRPVRPTDQQRDERGARESNKVCNYCHKRGHWRRDCYALKSRLKHTESSFTPKPAMFVAPVLEDLTAGTEAGPQVAGVGLKSFKPFISDGVVSLVGSDKKVRVKILRDTAAFDSFILTSVLPFSDETYTGSFIPVLGMGLKVLRVPQHKMMLSCDLFQGEVVVGVRPALPLDGIEVILGNGICGSKVWGDVPPPIVVPVPLVSSEPDKNEREFPDVFTACAVTRAMARTQADGSSAEEVDSSLQHDVKCSDLPWSVSYSELVEQQQTDVSLKALREMVCPVGEVGNHAQCYFIDNGVLVRKWVPQWENFVGDPVYQVVVPTKFRSLVLQMSHNESGHLGVRKTYDRILRYFFWPRLKRDVSAYIKSCHTCQFTSKPNQTLKPAPLFPIPAVRQPFEHLVIDCVGPLPPSRSGVCYLLTVMCQSTRYPAAYPLRTITTRSVVRALSQFIAIFGIPRVIQSDQGSNFSSHLFSQVLKQLRVKHNQASAYHAQSQGVLERFHQTLKAMLRAYCVEMKGDWEEGLPWLLLAAREVVQESIGFSPNDLVFGHTVRGPLALLRDNWKEADPPRNLLEYVYGFRYRLYRAQEVAKSKLVGAQSKMKKHYDRRVEDRVFLPGDQVLVLLPIVTSPFQAKFSGPYSVVEKLSDVNYLIATPDRRSSTHLCHVNLLKPYYSRVQESGVQGVQSSDVHPACVSVSPSPVMAEQGGDGVPGPDDAVLYGRLKNSETLQNLDGLLGHLEVSRRAQLVSLIRHYTCLFSDTPTRTHLIEHDIDVGDSKPIKQKFYRLHPEKRKFLDAEVKFMLENDMAEPSCSSWASPCLLVPKSDNTPRFCSDFRKVNSVTKPDCFPLPRVEDCVDQVGSAKFVSKFDLLKGYWQVPLSERARDIAAFITSTGLYSYSVMPFGLRNAPATFQRLMNRVVGDLEGCSVYLDDVVIYSDDWDVHLDRIGELFDRLAHAHLTVNLAKCDFAKATVTYLGRVVGQGRVCPVRAKVQAIDNYVPPTTKKELMRFLGLVGYYRCFCRNFSTVVAPLTNLLKAKATFDWSSECQSAFENVKAVICHAPVLAAPLWDRPFKVEVDASYVGAGAVLLQPDDLGVDKPVCFFSRKFNKHQLNYSVIEKETLALVLALQHFSVYVSSGPVVVFTDHNPLTFLSSLQCPNQRLIRWALLLQSFCLEIRHIKGCDNVVADALSRAPCD